MKPNAKTWIDQFDGGLNMLIAGVAASLTGEHSGEHSGTLTNEIIVELLLKRAAMEMFLHGKPNKEHFLDMAENAYLEMVPK
jgi:hypothetical protein